MRWHTAALLLASLIKLSFTKEKPLQTKQIKKTLPKCTTNAWKMALAGKKASLAHINVHVWMMHAASSHATTSCDRLYEGLHNYGRLREEYYVEKFSHEGIISNVELLWDDALEHAAGALFRAACIAAGYRPESIKTQWCASNKHAPVTTLDTMTVRVILAPKLHVRLTSRAAVSPACDDFRSVYSDDVRILLECDFLLPGEKEAIFYIPNDWNGRRELDEEFYWNYSRFWKIEHVERSHLKHLVHKSNHSFIFFDADIWSNWSSVRLSQCDDELLCAHETVSMMMNDVTLPVAGPFMNYIEKFSPGLRVLRNVIEIATQNHSTIEESACEWVLNNINNLSKRKYTERRKLKKTIVIIICETEKKDLDEYLYLTETMAVSRNSIQLYRTNCQDTHWLLSTLLFWSEKNLVQYKTAVVLTNDMMTAVAPIAESIELPLLTYDMSIDTNDETWSRPGVRSATGRVAHLDLSLRRLLADCGWRRLAIVSESTRLASALSAALRAPAAGLTVREMNVTSSSAQKIRSALQELLAAGTRVFLVNTDASAAAVVLATAQELNITRDAGFVWIVREYGAADKATATTRPLSVSFRWRGDIADEASNSTLLTKLEARWRGRAWPLHAASLVDAILTPQGAKPFLRKWLKFLEKGNIKIFWDSVQNTNISGIKQTLLYDEQGVANPIVYVEQWGAAPQPRLLAEWHADQWRESAQCPMVGLPPSDGFVRCVVPTGDPFQPTCRDTIWLLSVISATLVSGMLIFLAIRQSRQALAARDQRMKADVAERMLARRERVFAALAAHLVDRSRLELHQELGGGRFGVVRLGVLRKPGRTHHAIVVAAKALREDASPAEESEFLREACTLAGLEHKHVVRFLGVCVIDGPPLLLMEHASFNDLLRYLQARRYLVASASLDATCPELNFEENKFVSAEALTRLAQEAATALAYISQRGIVHRDVRASNCLVDERRSLKLADFGLARSTGTIDGEYMCNRRGMFPVLWMAPESLANGVSSPASDVWSFGVLVFELVTMGRRPYGSQAPPSVLRHVLGGGRPRLPWDASAETLLLVRECWRRAPEARPTAAQLAEWLTARRRALRPALATELVEIDSDVDGNNKFNEPDLNVCISP